MRKIYSLLSVLIASGLGFTANAQIEPSSIVPESGAYSFTSNQVEYAIVTPAELSKIAITFSGFDSMEVDPQADDIYVGLDWNDLTYDYDGGEYYIPASEIEVDGLTAYFSLPEIEEARYDIIIPWGAFIFDGDVDKESDTIWLYYKVWEGMTYGEILSQPSYISSLNANPIEITWDYQDLTPGENGLYVEAYWGYIDMMEWGFGGVIDIPAEAVSLISRERPSEGGEGGNEPSPAIEAGNTLYVDLAPYMSVHTVAQVTIVIPAGVVINGDGNPNPEQSIIFNAYDIWEGSAICEETEESGIYNITWDGIDAIAVANSLATNPFIVGSDGEHHYLTESYDPEEDGIQDGEYAAIVDYNYETGEATAYLVVNINGMDLADGTYSLVLPEAVMLLSHFDAALEDYFDYINNEQFIPIIIGDISNEVKQLTNDTDRVYRVYNLQGMKVLETSDSNDLNSLNGLYIINGRKVIIRK